MALLFYDGFEGLNVLANSAAGLLQRYNLVTTSGNAVLTNSINPTPPNGYAWGTNNISYSQNLPGIRQLVTAHASGATGLRFLPAVTSGTINGGTAQARFLVLQEVGGTADHLSVLQKTDGAIEVRRGTNAGTILGTSATGVLAVGVWSYVEVKYVIDDTNGGVLVRVDGVDVLKLGAYADTPVTLDTRNAGTAGVVDRIGWCATATTANCAYFDDIYICDLTGAAPYNDFLGDVRVIEMLPDAAGDSTQFTPNAGANWDRNDETPGHDSDTTYVESTTAGHKDLYSTVNPATSAATIYAAKVVCVARKTDAGDQALELGVKAGTTESFGTATNLADSYTEYTNTLLTNPDTAAAWTTAGLNGTQVGFRIPT